MDKIRIALNNEQNIYRLPVKRIKEIVKKVVKEEGCKKTQVNILFTDDKGIRKYNRKYRNKNKATDVLSFYQTENKKEALRADLLGDIVISVETARRKSEELGLSTYSELALYLIHGLLHLLHYTDETVKSRQKLQKKQESLFNSYAKEKIS